MVAPKIFETYFYFMFILLTIPMSFTRCGKTCLIILTALPAVGNLTQGLAAAGPALYRWAPSLLTFPLIWVHSEWYWVHLQRFITLTTISITVPILPNWNAIGKLRSNSPRSPRQPRSFLEAGQCLSFRDPLTSPKVTSLRLNHDVATTRTFSFSGCASVCSRVYNHF